MNCPACHQENPTDSLFCEGCGATLEASCPSCGASASSSANFCRKCGHTLTGEAAAKASPSGPTPRDYTPKHLADKILTSKSALEGERKQVTVLFADVKGSMDLAEQVDAEAWHKILNRFFEILSDGVHRFEGTVNQYTGDGIMALFGAPITHEDHAHRACYAALRLGDDLRAYSEELKRTKGLNFAARMGLNSGEVVVGKIGDDLRMDYTAQGHTVGLASRLEQLADPGKIYVSGHTADLVSGFFKFRDLGAFELKGVREPLHVYDLEGPGEMRTRLDVSRARGLSCFVGRAGEMETLERAITSAIEGNAQVIGVVAEAGVGKSRLCYEFVEKCRARGLTINESHCVAHGTSVPFLPVLEMLRGYFGYTEHDDGKTVREKMAGKLLLLDDQFKESLPILFDFVGVPDPEKPGPKIDPEAAQRQLFGLIKQLIQVEGKRQPGLILIEDLHWIDAGSAAFLDALIEAMPGSPGLLLVNFRPEYHAGWMKKSYYQQFPLLPLGSEAIAELLGHLLGKDSSLAGLGNRISEQTRGNPFFIEEVIRSLAEDGVLEGTRGAYRLARPVEEVTIPATVHTVLAARIDRLQEREKQVLQTAAVVGKEFPESILTRVTDLPDIELGESLRALTAAEFIHEAAIYPEREFEFTHPLTQEVAYRSQLADRRKKIHGGVAGAIAELDSEKLDERAALLAHHWERAGETLEAAIWHHRAAEWAGARAPAEALRHAQRVRALLDDIAESPEAMGLGLMAMLQILTYGIRMGLSDEESTKIFSEGKSLAERSGNVHVLQILTVYYAATHVSLGRNAEGLELAREALRLAGQTGDEALILGANLTLMYALNQSGCPEEAVAVAERAFSRPPADPCLGSDILGFPPYIQGLNIRGVALLNVGRMKEAGRVLEQARELARKHDEREVLGWVQGNHVWLAANTGETEQVLACAREAFEIAEKLGSAISRVLAHWSMGLAHALREEWQEGAADLEQGIALARETRSALFMEPMMLSYLGECHAALGNAARARQVADEAVAICNKRGRDSHQATAHLFRGRVLLRTGGDEAAADIDASLADAMRVAQRMGVKWVEPHIHEARAELARLRGDEAARQSELRTALRLYREMHATGHVVRLKTELRE